MNVEPVFKHLGLSMSTVHQDQWILEFNKSKDLDASAPPKKPPQLFRSYDFISLLSFTH